MGQGCLFFGDPCILGRSPFRLLFDPPKKQRVPPGEKRKAHNWQTKRIRFVSRFEPRRWRPLCSIACPRSTAPCPGRGVNLMGWPKPNPPPKARIGHLKLRNLVESTQMIYGIRADTCHTYFHGAVPESIWTSEGDTPPVRLPGLIGDLAPWGASNINSCGEFPVFNLQSYARVLLRAGTCATPRLRQRCALSFTGGLCTRRSTKSHGEFHRPFGWNRPGSLLARTELWMTSFASEYCPSMQ